MKHVTIPNEWSGEEALKLVAFLERVIEAVWRAHGREMGYHLEYLHTALFRPPYVKPLRPLEKAPAPRVGPAIPASNGDYDDDIPW